ncbi:F-box-like domain-containing protein [Hirsutella rhossiliensis]|uniref:F-box-like domain-containing protein n=1 Tax=Hirsutella rhossiliensis TaxID=111463 RepID=A0A9P8MZS4_9HYPO|nr:f-box-like domain-containing protein [Hirsutella rhossiliensis]KAH0965483.1 f-box-like domain-containing protein [Hirsutella rhossiliensis]
MAAKAGGDEAAARTSLSFLHLPPETQQDIISHCSQADLICVALVCKRFHELASAQLYRNFHIVFPDEDDINFDSPIDGLAGGLDTFTTSDYNYAKYLRDLSMDTLSAGVKGEKSYQPYVYTASCGKFLNSLLHLTLRKATSLETFRWNIRVELSRPVYRELHRIQSLTRLHVRMQNGNSYYNPPPPLPAEPSTFSGFKNLKALSVLDIESIDVVPEIRACVKNSFSTLKELQLSLSDDLAQQSRKPPPDSDAEDSDLDDDFQVVSQSINYDASGPAKAFRAQEERKLHEAILGKILDIEQTLVKKSPIRPKAQESAWGHAKSDEPAGSAAAQSSHEDFISSIKRASARLIALQNGSRDFSVSQQDILDIIEKAARKYVDSCDHSPLQGTEGTGAASEKLGELDKVEGDPVLDAAQQTKQGSVADHSVEGQSAHPEDAADGESPSSKCLGENVTPESPPNKLPGEEVVPDDIDIAHIDMIGDEPYDYLEHTTSGPSGDEFTRGSQTTTTQAEVCGTAASETTKPPCGAADESRSAPAANQLSGLSRVPRAALRPLWERLNCLQNQFSKVAARVEKFRSQAAAEGYPKTGVFDAELKMLNQSVGDMFNEIQAIEAEALAIPGQKAARPLDQNPKEETVRRSMVAYARDTRGLSVESLSIHLVPVKASVLSRGVDLASLRQLTLLNVGNQVPIWTLLAKEGRTRPLALRSVFTDHVTTAFLSCMAQLPELHDLFLLERSAKHKPESFASRTTTTIDQIRRLVLKRHMPTLKRLMIKDETRGPNWDVNEKTMILVCTRGVHLEELALSMNIHAVHAFMQYFSGLSNLRAINILHFKNNDTCIWVMREILRFIVDNLSHHPELKLEWIAMEDERVDRVVRPSEVAGEAREAQPTKRSKGKSKGKAHVPNGMTLDGAYPLLPVDGLESESDSDGEVSDSGTRLRFKTVGPLQFYDVWGVKIFEKEVRSGRL